MVEPARVGIGARTPRVEDAALVRGRGRYLDDIHVPGALEAVFLRSPVAHGLIRELDLAAARAHPGVRAVFAYDDLRARLTMDRIPLALPAAGIRFHVDPPVLAREEVCYVGEPIAVIIADSRRVAEDAAALIDLDIETLPAVADPVKGLEPGAPRARLDCPDNFVASNGIDYGDIEAAFAGAAHVIKEHFRLDKGGGHSIEPRGVIARHDPLENRLTVWDSTQMPHRTRGVLVTTLGLDEEQVRVIAPDVGGGFGPKAVFHPEELAIPAAALLLGQPVKWVEDRFESFTATIGERETDWDMEAAFDADGRLRGIRGRLRYDHGAATPYGVAYVMERLLDAMAARIGLPRDEIRRRNFIAAHQMPYAVPVKQRDGSLMTYDSGEYPECQRRALAAADWADFPARQAAALKEGRYIGLGLTNYVEGTGRGPFESAAIRIGPSGKVVVTTGATAQGQGVQTMLAQIVAGVLGLEPQAIQVIAGDTNASPMGLGAFASRQAVTAGNAVFQAATLVAEKAKAAASTLLEASPDDLELHDGAVRVKGVPGHQKTLAEIARSLAGAAGFALPAGMTPGLAAATDFLTTGLTYTNGCHLAEVEVDPETGGVRILRYTVVHDCGTMINPMMVEGQILGGVAHGVGMTLFEWMRYDDQAQPLTATFADYLLPTADVLPRIDIHHMVSPTPLNPLGVKGAAESGTIGAPATIVSAIEDALSPFGVRIRDLPLTPARLRALVRERSAA